MAYCLAKPVFFIGFMGAGKTSVSRLLAESLDVPLADVDEAVELQAGCTIAQLFASQGEEAFRDLESAVLAQLAAEKPALVSCGGGVVERPANVAIMKSAGYVVYLNVSADEARNRVGSDPARPLFGSQQDVEALLGRRAALYASAADACVDTTDRSVFEVADAVREELVTAGVLF